MGDTLEWIGVGGPDHAAVDVARDAGLKAHVDLRRLLMEKPAAYLLVAVRGGIDRTLLQAAAEQDTRVITTEPPAASLLELGQPWVARVSGHVLEVPRFDRSPGVELALDPERPLAGPLQVRLVSHGRPHEGSLLSRLLDAWRTVLRFVELPETLLAAWTPAPGDDSLRHTRGQVAVLARCRGGSTVSLDVAANAARSIRSLRTLGPREQLEVHTASCERLALGPEADLDSLDTRPPAPAPPFVDQVAGRWRWHLHHPHALAPGVEHDARALACIEAMQLSTRTGQPEAPERLLRISGRA